MSIKYIAYLLVIVFVSCKKYEEDDKRYLKTPCGRVAKKWKLNKILDANGKEFTDSVIYYTPAPGEPLQSIRYGDMILEFERSENKLCLETGIRGKVKSEGVPVYERSYYELQYKRTHFKFDIRPSELASIYYFIDDYKIYKMTKDELVFGHDRNKFRAYFIVAN